MPRNEMTITQVRPAGDNHQVVSVEGGRKLYRRQPCSDCPWRKDAVGEFPPEAFRHSAATAYDMSQRTFACHQSGTQRPAACAGFLLRGADHNLSVRLAYLRGDIGDDVQDAGVPLHESYRAMAIANGVDPDDDAIAPCRKLESEMSQVERCIGFLTEIGLSVSIQPGATGFTAGVDILDGELYVDPDVACASNLLHEAGHLAIVPAAYRHLFQTNVAGGQEAMMKAIYESGAPPDSAVYRAALQATDPEATAWAWAAGKALGLPEEDVIQDHEYGEDGASIRLMLRHSAYVGINGMANAGFCAIHRRAAQISGLPVYPELAMWTQP